MDSFEWNKIAGAVLGTLLIVFGLSIFSGILFETEAPETPGYVIAVAEEAGEGEGEAAAGGEEAPAQPIGVLLASADPAAGEAAAKKCATCHTFGEGEANKIGPNLYEIVNRPIASHEGYEYSPAMQAYAETAQTWTFEHLNTFLLDPDAAVPETKMAFPGLKADEERANVIAYLRSLSASPAPLPEPEAEAAEAAPAGGEQPAAEGEAAEAPAAPAEGEQQQAAAEAEQPAAAGGGAEAEAPAGGEAAEQPAQAAAAEDTGESGGADDATAQPQGSLGAVDAVPADQQGAVPQTPPVDQSAPEPEAAEATEQQPAQEQAAAAEQGAEPAPAPTPPPAAEQETAQAEPAPAQPEEPAGEAAPAEAAPAAEEATQVAGDPAAGEAFARRCVACHSFEEGGANKVGPNLWGVVGRPVASVEDYAYSEAMTAFSEGGAKVWDPGTLHAYLADPRGVVPGTKMVFPGIKNEDDLANVVAYLQSLQ
jgi:cytochrome c2